MSPGVLLSAVLVLAVWIGGYYMPKGIRRAVLIVLAAGAAVLFACTVSKWRWNLLAAGMMVGVCIIWEMVPRYHHGRRYDNKDRRKTLPFWEDLCAFASIGIAVMAAENLL